MSSNHQPTKISTFILCCNEEKKIRQCLESISWSDEIIIVDSGSTDQTLDIAREFTDKIYHNDWPGFVAQKKYGLSLCSNEWVLNIDSDEVVSPELQNEIKQKLQLNDPEIHGFEINRVVYFLGKWWRKGGWYPEYRLRLLRKSHTTWGGVDPHEKAIVTGKVERIKGELLHFTYDSIHDQIQSLNNHSTWAAKSLAKEGEQTTFVNIVLRPISRFIKFYFLKKGFLEGLPGVLVAILEAYYTFLKYLKLWEINNNLTEKK